MDFNEFVAISREALKKGEIKVSKEITDFDLAVQFAIGQIGDRRGYEEPITVDEIASEIMKFAPELLEAEK